MAVINGLLIAPMQSGVSWSSEIADVTDNFNFDVVTGDITREDVFDRAAGEQYSIIHIAAHGAANGVGLSGTDYLTIEDLILLAKQTQAKTVFLNACRTAKPAQAMIDAGIPCVLAYTDDVLDKKAWDIARLFYGTLAIHGSIEKTYNIANPRDGSFMRIESRADSGNRDIRYIKRNILLLWLLVVASLCVHIFMLLYFIL